MTDAALGEALRQIANGDWDAAHRIVQDMDSAEAAWIHAHLHRIEGDPVNAAYWYRRAGRPIATGDAATERAEIAAGLGV